MTRPVSLDVAYKRLRDFFIPHAAFVDVQTRVERRIDRYLEGLPLPCMHVAGFTGVGKSVLVAKLRHRYPPVRDASVTVGDDGQTRRADKIQLVAVRVTSSPTVTKIFRDILKEVGDPFHNRGLLAEMEERIALYFKACGTRVLVIDEAQRVVDMNGQVACRAFGFFLQNIYEQSGVLVVLLGLGRASFLFKQDWQIARRFDDPVRFQPYEWDEDADRNLRSEDDPDRRPFRPGRDAFLQVLATYKQMLGIPWSPELESDALVGKRFFYASQGVIGYLEKLLAKAVELMMENDSTVVTHAVLREAYEKAFGPGSRNNCDLNAFSDAYRGELPPELPDHDSLVKKPKAAGRGSSRDARSELDRALRPAR